MSLLDRSLLDFDAAYDVFVNHATEFDAIVRDWYRQFAGREPALSDVHHAAWRAIAERDRWGTVRRALEEAWPIPAAPPPPPPPFPPPVDRRSGVVRLEGRTFADAGGVYEAVGTTMFWGLWGYLHDRERLADNLRFVADRGIDYIRVLALVHGESWADRAVTPADLPHVGAFTVWVFDSFGLRVQWTIFGGIDDVPAAADRRRAVETVADQLAAVPHAVQCVEIANEGYNNGFGGAAGQAELRDLAAAVRQRGVSGPLALSAPAESTAAGVDELYAGSVADLVSLHLDRSTTGTGGIWRPVRQARDGADLSRAWVSNEPIGPFSSVAADDDPLRLVMAAVCTWVCRGAAYVLHTGPGIRGGGAADAARGRPANIWETPHIETTLAGLRAARGLVPADTPNGAFANANRTYARAYPFAVEPFEEVGEEGMLRAFASLHGDGRFVIAPIAVAVPVPFIARWPMQVTVYDPLTGGVRDESTLAAGGRIVLEPANGAAIIRGRRTA
jgi:hypothetical protein